MVTRMTYRKKSIRVFKKSIRDLKNSIRAFGNISSVCFPFLPYFGGELYAYSLLRQKKSLNPSKDHYANVETVTFP